ncbi:TonB-dependent siderophore receptor [Thalassotalea fusca]
MKSFARQLPFSLSLVTIALGFSVNALSNDVSNENLEHIEVTNTLNYRSTATKSSLKAVDSPMSVSVVDQELLKMRQADTVAKALRYVSGVTSESRSTITIFDQYNIRGFDTYQSFYDGLPLLTNNAWNLYPQVDAFATEAVEVLKGPASSLYGLVPPGGMVNQVAKSPQSIQSTTTRLTVGSDNLLELGVDSTGAISDNTNYRLIMLGKQRDGQQATTETSRFTIAPSVSWEINDKNYLTVNLYYQNDPEMVPSTPLPAVGTLYTAPYGKLDANAYAGDKNWNEFDREVTMLGYKYVHTFNNEWSFLQNFRYTDANALQRNMYNYGLAADKTTLIRSAYETDEAIEGFTVDNQLSAKLSVGNTTHHLLLGFDYQKSNSDVSYRDTLGTATPTIDLSDPDYAQIDPAMLPVDFYQEMHSIKQKQAGFYLQDEISVGKLLFVINGRYDQFDSSDIADNNYAGTEYGGETNIDQSKFSGRIAAMYTFDSGYRVYANYSESFEPVSGTDAETGKAFKPTTADQIEAGVKYQSNDGNITFNGAYFVLTKENVVVNTQDFAKKTQTGEIESKGFELELNANLTDNLTLVANYTNLDMEITENELDPLLVGKTPVWVADQTASVWANYYFDAGNLNGLMVGLGARYVGETQLDQYNTDTVPSYTLVDLVASYDIATNSSLISDMTVAFSVSNLSDKTYVGACYDINNCWMGAERTAELSFQASF